MILTDEEIRKAIDVGRIEITNFDPAKLGSNSYDLTLSKELLVYTDMILDCRKQNKYSRMVMDAEGQLLLPGELYLGVTRERTSCGPYMPFIEGKSSVGRLGISVHITAGVGDIGFAGHWTLEITVTKPVIVYPGMPIAQLLFLVPLGQCLRPYNVKSDAKYHDQPGLPMPSQMWKNFKQVP